jgi:hypothetical protein
MKDGERTIEAREAIFPIHSDEYEELLLEDIKYAEELDEHNYVLEGVVERLTNMGIECDEKDPKNVVKSLNKLYKETGVSNEGAPRAVKNWINNGIHANPEPRRNLYNLCYAMKMNEEETKEFFLKHFLTIPYNYKNITDAIFYFGVKQGLDYNAISGLLSEFTEEVPVENEDCEKTEDIGNAILDISDINIFREYLQLHRYSKQKQFNTASKKIKELLYASAIYAEKERKLRPELLRRSVGNNANLMDEISIVREDGDINIRGLLFVIYGGLELYGNSYEDDDATESHSISKSTIIPKLFRTNFPKEQEFARIAKKEASPDVYRKALVILHFYSFFSRILFGPTEHLKPIGSDRVNDLERRTDEQREEDYNDFDQQTSEILANCGFVQLYARNPFDWLIMYCARSYNPIQTFRELLSKASDV